MKLAVPSADWRASSQRILAATAHAAHAVE
jgi:hypothetical protein